MKEREISLVDLLVYILLRWRRIIVWMLVGGVLMGGLGYVYSMQSVAAQKVALEQQQDAQTELAALEVALTEAQKNSVRAVINNEKFSEYYNHSLLMQVDATNVPRTELSFLIVSVDIEKSYSIKCIYEELLSCGLFQWFADRSQNGIVVSNLSELITVNGRQRYLMDNNTIILNDDGSRTDSLKIVINHVTEAECKELAQWVIEYLEEQHDWLVQELGAHELELIDYSFAYVTDSQLLNQQRTMLNNIINGNTNVEKLQKGFTAGQQRYYTLLKTDALEEGVEPVTTVTVSAFSGSVKYIFIGMLLFVFVYVFYLFMKYIFNNKLRVTDDIKLIYNLPLLGTIHRKTFRKKPFVFVDSWLMKLRDHNKRSFSEEEATGLAAVAVKMQAKKEGLDAVYCIGCDLKDNSLQVVEQMQMMLKKDDITINVLNNVLYNQEAMEQLQGAKAVFLLEKAGETLYDEITQELELLERQDIKVLGAVVVE
ncbi:MAG: hypothetical protein ACI4HQ_06925 [Acetatifactor sp.]